MTPNHDKASGLTPLMQQYYAVKEKHPDKILFFRMGDFYEMFADDAIMAAPILGIALTSRSHGSTEKIPLAGVPYHSADKYLARLLAAGKKVVVVEQVEDPKTAKGIVKRDIVEILTPGTATIDTPEASPKALCLAAVYDGGSDAMGLAALDITTGAFMVDEGPAGEIIERLRVLEPSEVIYPAKLSREEFSSRLGLTNGHCSLTDFGDWNFDQRTAERELNQHFGTSTLEGFGVGDKHLAVAAAGAIFRYLRENYRDKLSHIDKLSRFDSGAFMVLDYSSVRNLELVRSIAGSDQHTLFSVINRCHTAAGSRRLLASLLRPYKTRDPIERRLGGITELIKNRETAYAIRKETQTLTDLEKLTGRLGIGKLSPRQAMAICQALETAARLKEALVSATSPHLSGIAASLPTGAQVVSKIRTALTDDPPMTTNKGEIFRRGYSQKLDDLNDSIHDARLYIGSLQAKERERTGITTLKVGFNKVFGYYIEVTRANAASVPQTYIRKQTLVNAERYVTPELKEKEELILNAEEKIFRLEEELYQDLIAFLGGHISELKLCADLLAEIDVVSGLAELAVKQGYARPEIFDDTRLVIVNGRHPVIEAVLPPGSFVANDVQLSAGDNMIHILTGPNMSGKSTYLRQIGLIVIMAQIGSYVPVDHAEIGLVDRVFTRVGALDNLARGQSTFLVEMVETANIVHNATERSLILLDEVGRGTSTFDGLSVAWAVVERINENIKARTVFATHYHELTGMAETMRAFPISRSR